MRRWRKRRAVDRGRAGDEQVAHSELGVLGHLVFQAAHCFDDRLEYKIAKHPEEGLIYMFMNFRHYKAPSYFYLFYATADTYNSAELGIH